MCGPYLHYFEYFQVKQWRVQKYILGGFELDIMIKIR